MNVNERIKAVRKHEGLTLDQFGGKVALAQSTLSDIERGKGNVTDRLIMMVVKEFGVSETWLRNGDGEMFPPPSERDRLAALITKMLRNRDDLERQYITEFIYNKMNDDELDIMLSKIIEFVDGLKNIRESHD